VVWWGPAGASYTTDSHSFRLSQVCCSCGRPNSTERNRQFEFAGPIEEGMRYAWSHSEIRVPLLLMLVIGTLAYNFNVVLPLLARFTFQSGAGSFGALMSMLGIGAFLGALISAFRSKPTQSLLAFAAFLFGVLMLVAAIAPSLMLEMIVLYRLESRW